MSSETDGLRIVRTFEVPRERMYRAWTDAADLARWNYPAGDMTLTIDTVDVRVGGRYQSTFGRPGELPWVESCEYREVVPGRRLAFDSIVSRAGTVVARTRCTVEFLDRGTSMQIILTDEGDGAGEHAGGWGHGLDQLAKLLA
jgi:uncharacterized protein YndB with AHSA1/START domain